MKRILFAALCAFSLAEAAGQPRWQWAKTDVAARYAINPSYARHAFATAGGKSFWAVIQNRKLVYGQAMMGDYVFRELDSAGNTLATASASGKFALLKAQADAAGNWYLLGTYYDSVVLSPGLRLTRSGVGFGSDYFLFRLRAGTLQPDWLQTLGSNSFCQASCFTIANDRLFLPLDSALDTHICQYDLNNGAATRLWTQNGRSYTADIQADSMGNLYLLGTCVLNGPLDFNGSVSVIPAGVDYAWYIARYHADGRHHWHYYLNDITCTDRGFRLHGNNEIYLSGTLMDSASLAGFTFNKPSRMFNGDYLMARLDSNGTLMWAQQRPVTRITQGNVSFSTAFHSAVLDTALFLLCETQGASVWGGSGIVTNTNNRHWATLVAFSKENGQALWAKTIQGIFTSGQQLISDGSSLWAVGNGMDSAAITFDTLSIASSTGTYLPFLAKMQIVATKDSVPSSTGIGPRNANSIRLWPNPARGFVMLEGLSGNESIALRALSGRLLLQVANDGKNRLQIATGTLAKGLYMIDMAGPQFREIRRVAIE